MSYPSIKPAITTRIISTQAESDIFEPAKLWPGRELVIPAKAGIAVRSRGFYKEANPNAFPSIAGEAL